MINLFKAYDYAPVYKKSAEYARNFPPHLRSQNIS